MDGDIRHKTYVNLITVYATTDMTTEHYNVMIITKIIKAKQIHLQTKHTSVTQLHKHAILHSNKHQQRYINQREKSILNKYV